MVTPAQPLPCPICAASVEITPATYTEQACTVCGCGLVLRQSRDVAGEPLAWQFACRCPYCQRELRPGEEYVTGLFEVRCPYCGGQLWALEFMDEPNTS